MPFKLIKGAFAPGFGRPDGDSMRFVPDDPAPLFRLRRRGAPPKVNPNNGSIQLRYEAIDTMESRAGALADAATRSNLELAGFGGDAPPDTARGEIYTTQLGPNGRPIVFAFAGDSGRPDGEDVFLGPDDIMASLNLKQIARGHAYPLFYDTLFDDLRERCADVSNAAKAGGVGVWARDATTAGARWTGDVETLAPIFPKLWRRIDRFARDETLFDPATPFRHLKLFLEMNEERVTLPARRRFTGFDDLVETTDDTVRLTAEPHEMVFVSS